MHSPAGPPGRGATRVAVGVTAVSLAVVGLPTVASAAPTAPYTSEIHYDDAGADTGQFVEVTIPPGTTSAGLSVVLYNGSGGAPYATSESGAVSAPADAPAAPSAPCDVPPGEVTPIGAVQGSGSATPLAGQTVTVRGTVVGDLQGENGLEGFHLQDAGDGDAATSDGVFVLSTVPVALGDEVAVTGVPSESSGQTQITARTDVAVCADDLVAAPGTAFLDLPAGDDVRERLEGMRVEPADELTVSEVFALTRYGELTLSEGGVLVQPTEVARPGTPEAAAVVADNGPQGPAR